MGYRTFLIGRSATCEIEIPNSHVSREHAELIIADNGDMLLVDRASDNQTFIQRGESWTAVRQELISDVSRIRFGSYETSGADLRRVAGGDQEANEKTVRMDRIEAPLANPGNGDGAMRRRDPETGRIIG